MSVPEHFLAPPLPVLESSATRQLAHIELLVGTSEELLVQVEDAEEGHSQRDQLVVDGIRCNGRQTPDDGRSESNLAIKCVQPSCFLFSTHEVDESFLATTMAM